MRRRWTPSVGALGLLFVAILLAGCGGKPAVNQPPVASFTITEGSEAGTFTVDASASRDPEGATLTYLWDWVAGNGTGKTLTIDAPTSGNATLPVVLVVRDDKGAFGTSLKRDAIKIGGGDNQNPKIDIVDVARWVRPGAALTFDASASADPDGDPLQFEWIWGPYEPFDPSAHDARDPLKSQNTTAQTFNSGELGPGATFNQTFEKAGIYNYVCHPHPWMQARIIADPQMNGTAAATVAIEGYAFLNRTVRVGVGSTVRFVNRDPDVHTASATDFISGTLVGGTGPTFAPPTQEGDHIVRVIATDGVGGRFSASYGLKVSADAPEPTKTFSFAADPTKPESAARSHPTPNHPVAGYFYLNYTAMLNGTLTWQDPSGGTLNNASVDIENVLGDRTSAISCAGTKTANQAEYTFQCRHVPADLDRTYLLRVVALQGLVDWRLSFTAREFLSAGYGDFKEGFCHVEPGGKIHCV